MNLSNKNVQEYIRKSPRVPVTAMVQTSGQVLALCFARNISINGMLLEVPQGTGFVEVGQSMQLVFTLPFGKQPVQCTAKISGVGQTTDGGGKNVLSVGLTFVAIDQVGQEEIANYITRYKEAQKQHAAEIQDAAARNELPTELTGRPVQFYIDSAADVAGGQEPTGTLDKELWKQLQTFSVTEKTALLGEAITKSSLPLKGDRIKPLQNALGLLLKIQLEAPKLQLLLDKDAKKAKPIFDEYQRLINFESDLCIEGIQQIQSQALTSNDEPVKQLCTSIRDRLVKALSLSKSMLKVPPPAPISQEAASTQTRPVLIGPWGEIYTLSHYRQLFEQRFAGKLDNPIEEGEIDHFLNDQHPLAVKVLKSGNEDPNWDIVINAILLDYKILDELNRLRAIEGRHLEYLEDIREIFRLNSKEVSAVHEPLRKLFALDANKKPSAVDQEKRAAVEKASEQLLDGLSQLSDFTNLLIPGAVALSDANSQYAKGQFKAAIQAKAQKVSKWMVKRQRTFIAITVVVVLLAGAYHAKDMLVFKRPVEISELSTSLPLTAAYIANGELIGTTIRRQWVQLPIAERQVLARGLFDKGKEVYKIKGMKLIDEKRKDLAVTVYSGSDTALSFTRLEEDAAASKSAGR